MALFYLKSVTVSACASGDIGELYQNRKGTGR